MKREKVKKTLGHIKTLMITISPILLENSWGYKFNDTRKYHQWWLGRLHELSKDKWVSSSFSNLFCLLLVIFFNIIRFIDIFN